MLSCHQEIITLFFISNYYDSYCLFLHFCSGWHLFYNIIFSSFLTSLLEYNCWLDLVMKATLISFPISGETCSIRRDVFNRRPLFLVCYIFLTWMGIWLIKCFFRIPGILTGNFCFWNEKKSGISWATHLWQGLNSQCSLSSFLLKPLSLLMLPQVGIGKCGKSAQDVELTLAWLP